MNGNWLPELPLHVSPMVAFGVLLLLGVCGGFLAHKISWLPSITGFMLVGFGFGPSGLGVLGHELLESSRFLVDIALGMILYRLGLSLDVKWMRRTPKLFLISLVESLLTFGLVYGGLLCVGVEWRLAAVIGAIGISSSPAVLLHVAHEEHAAGKVTHATKSLVAMNNVVAFLVFMGLLPLFLVGGRSGLGEVMMRVGYGALGSVLLGLLVAVVLHGLAVRLRDAVQYQFAVVIGAIMLTLGLAGELKLSMLFAPLVMGVAVKYWERGRVVSRLDFGASLEVFFILLFVMAGANLHVHELVRYGPVILVVVGLRSLAKYVGVCVSGRLCGFDWRDGRAAGMLMIPMAGLAIGLSRAFMRDVPEFGEQLSAIVLGAVAVFETMGPPIAAYAFRVCGEAGSLLEGEED